MSELTLLLPGLLGPLPEDARGWDALDKRLPALAKLLARGKPLSISPDVASLFGWSGQPEALPAAALGYLGEGGDPGDAAWLRADPVHLRADQDRIMLFAATGLDLDMADAEPLVAELNRFLEHDGLRLFAPVPERWYLRLERVPAFDATPTLAVSSRYIDGFLPHGPDAAEFSRLATELQMLLHMSETNARREARGLSTINGVWLWGGGRLPDRVETDLTRVYSDDPVVRGLAQTARLTSEALPAEFGNLSTDGAVLLVDDAAEQALAGGDLNDWLAGVEALERRWLEPAVQAVGGGRLDRLVVSTGDRAVRLTRPLLARFWRRPRSLKALLYR